MGHGIIFVGGSSNLRENRVYKGSKDNWGMYKYHPSKVKFNEKKLILDQVNENSTNINGNSAKESSRTAKKQKIRKKLYREIRKNANELHSISVRRKLSHQLYSKYQLESEEMIFSILNAYFDCCTDIKFAKKGQISTVKQNIGKYLANTNLSSGRQHSFIMAENNKKLKSNGVINSENVVNSLHRIFLLNQSVPKKLMELATNKKVGFSKVELRQLAELYQIVLQNSEGETIDQICEKHKYVLLSKNSQALQTRISEFAVKKNKSKKSLNKNKDWNMTKEKAPKKIKKKRKRKARRIKIIKLRP